MGTLKLRVAAATLDTIPLDWDHNLRVARIALQTARAADASLVVLPELALTGYGCEDAFGAAFVLETAAESLRALAADTRGLVVSVGLPHLHGGAVLNCSALLVDGTIAGLVAKRALAGDGIHYEPRWFKAWPAGHVHTTTLAGHAVPLGDLMFEVGGVRLGFEICEDAWVADRPGIALARRAVDVILNPSASHFALGKRHVRERFVVEGSRAFSASYVYANLSGNEAGRAIYDGGALVASEGAIVARGPRLGFAEFELTSAVVDVTRTRMARARTHSFRPDWAAPPPEVVSPFAWPPVHAPPARDLPAPQPAPWEDGPDAEDEELTRALAVGLFGYLAKSKSQGFVVSLSGGADSTAVACLVHLMARLATDALGTSGLATRLAHLPDLEAIAHEHADPATRARALTRRLLLTAYQATSSSSTTTRDAARAVADALGAEHHTLDLSAIHAGYLALHAQATGRALDWDHDDVALQNVQARTRAPSIWLFANVARKLLLTTSNRSEAAVGYATMDGDTAGGLAPIAGVDKPAILRWLRWLEATGPSGVGPLPAVSVVTRLAPTAELRPAERAQTDEADLMPYAILDEIERRAIRDKESPAVVLAALAAGHASHDRATLVVWVRRFFRLWAQNQWKRERFAPSFHVDDENLDPKTWCRFPILSSGLARELAALDAPSTTGG
jgi:NAD+ synthase (glutamine-hydrolysing)